MADVQANVSAQPESAAHQHIDVPDSITQFRKEKSKIQEETEDFE